MFAFPYAGPNRIRFKGLISGRGVPRPPPGSDDEESTPFVSVWARHSCLAFSHSGQTRMSGHPGDRPDKNVWPTRSLSKCECHVRAGEDVIGWPDKKASHVGGSALSFSRIPRPHVVWARHSCLAFPATGQTRMSGPHDHRYRSVSVT